MTSSDSTTGTSLPRRIVVVATPASLKMPSSVPFAEAKTGVRVMSWQRKVQRFLTIFSVGFDLIAAAGDEQKAMKETTALAKRAWMSAFSSSWIGRGGDQSERRPRRKRERLDNNEP